MPESDLRQVRLDKLAAFKSAGQNPYPDRFERTHTLAALRKLKSSKPVRAAGRLMTMRTMGKLCFATIQDFSGKIQIALEREHIGDDQFKFFNKNFDLGDFVGVSGKLFKTKTGELTINVSKFQLLSKALLPLPEKWHGLKDQEACYRQRYLDLTMNEESKNRFILRSQVVQFLREFYWQAGFLEIESPVLENISSGAAAKPFITHHNALDLDVYLRIAGGELWHKMAIVGGFEKVFEIGHCFRNEGMDPSHLQEFTMLEHYVAYWNFEDNMTFTEKLFEKMIKQLCGSTKVKIKDREGTLHELNFKAPWPRYEFCELLKRDAGIDPLQFNDVKELRKAIKEKKIEIEDLEKLGLGNLLDALYKKVSRPQLLGPCFVTKHLAETKPLARRNDKNPRLCDTFQVLISGWEVVNAYSELTDPLDQRERFEKQLDARKHGDEEAMMLNEEYLTAMEHGMPPVSGWGMGIDRLVTLLSTQDNLRDVVLFPLMRPLSAQVRVSDTAPRVETQAKSSEINSALSIPAPGLSYTEALELLQRFITDPVTQKHSRESEVVMRALARRLGQDEEVWGIAGLLHDLDWDLTKNNDAEHCHKILEITKGTKLNPAFVEFLRSHAYGFPCGDLLDKKRQTAAEHALAAAETVTGLIFASALVQPEKKLATVKASSVLKKFKDKSFAAKVNREVVKEIELTGITLAEFIELALQAMQKISEELGL